MSIKTKSGETSTEKLVMVHAVLLDISKPPKFNIDYSFTISNVFQFIQIFYNLFVILALLAIFRARLIISGFAGTCGGTRTGRHRAFAVEREVGGRCGGAPEEPPRG